VRHMDLSDRKNSKASMPGDPIITPVKTLASCYPERTGSKLGDEREIADVDTFQVKKGPASNLMETGKEIKSRREKETP